MEQAERLIKTPVVVPADGDYDHGVYFAGDTARGFGVATDCACSAGINCAAAILARSIGIE
jgi:prolycopene isomerase